MYIILIRIHDCRGGLNTRRVFYSQPLRCAIASDKSLITSEYRALTSKPLLQAPSKWPDSGADYTVLLAKPTFTKNRRSDSWSADGQRSIRLLCSPFSHFNSPLAVTLLLPPSREYPLRFVVLELLAYSLDLGIDAIKTIIDLLELPVELFFNQSRLLMSCSRSSICEPSLPAARLILVSISLSRFDRRLRTSRLVRSLFCCACSAMVRASLAISLASDCDS